MNTNRHLYRCREDRRIAGVASGVAEFFDLDATVVRIVWFLSIFFGGLGIFVYIAMALIVPLEPLGNFAEAAIVGADGETAPSATHRHAPHRQVRWSLYIGAGLVLIGALALIDALVPGWTASRYLAPLFFVGIGAVLVAGALRRERTEA